MASCAIAWDLSAEDLVSNIFICQHLLKLILKTISNKLFLGGIIFFVILLIAIIVIAISGPRHLTIAPIINGRYVEAVTSCGLVEG